MQKLAELCVRRPVTAAVLILIFIVVGIAGYGRLGVDRFPQVDFPTVTVVTSQPGAAPDAIESEITDKIEESVNTIAGIEELRSSSSEGTSTVTIQFVLDKDVNVATQEVRDRVANIQNQLPEGVDPPTVRRFDSSQIPVVSIAVTAKKPLREITEWADKTLSRRLESISGVGQVDIRGGRSRQINVWLDAYKLRSFNLSVADVNNALKAQNVEIPGGRIDRTDKTLTLRTLGRITRIEDFNNIALRTDDGGGRVLLSDVARVEDGVAQATTFSEINGVSTVQVVVSKQSGTNTIAVIQGVKDRLKDLEGSATRGGFTLKVVRDQSDYIEASLHSVEEHLIVGAILATLVVLFFLWNWRSTLISAISIPTSIIATFALMYYAGFTLNLITLLALTLAVGIVIDDAIVVLENIYRHIEEKGMTPFEAAIEGTREIGFAVMATTLSLVAVFLPVAFMSGIVGRFMNSFGVTMSFAILISLLIAFTLVPSLSARWLKAPENHRPRENTEPESPRAAFNESSHSPQPSGGDAHVQSKDRGVYAAIDRFYTVLLKWSLGHRWVIVLGSIIVLFMTVPLIGMVRKNFLPDDDESQFQVSLELPQGSSLDASTKLARAVDKKMRSFPWVDYTILTAGDNNNLNESSLYVRMVDVKKRDISQLDAVQFVRDKVLPDFKVPGLQASAVPINSFAGLGGRRGQAKIQFAVSGPDLSVLRKMSQKALPLMAKLPGVSDVDTSLVLGKPELNVVVDREMAQQLGVSPSDVASALNYLVGGDQKVTDYNEAGEQYEVHVRAEEKFRTTEEGISLLSVPSTTLGTVGLDQVVRFKYSTGPTTIDRLNRQKLVMLLANTKPTASEGEITAGIRKIFTDMKLGPDYSGAPSGAAKEQARSFQAFLVAVGLSLIFMYLILAAQFESWLHPITILLSLPLTLPFALLSIFVLGQSLNIFSALGVLVLFGVVKKNAILQIDHTNKLREAGMNRYDALIQANRDRLRPILMTTLAFVAGMIPLVISSGTGSGTNRAVGSVVFGGQTLSLLLTLLATPVAYSLFDDLTNFLVKVKSRVTKSGPVAPRENLVSGSDH